MAEPQRLLDSTAVPDRDVAALRSLALAHPYAPLRPYARLGLDVAHLEVVHELDRFLSDPDSMHVISTGESSRLAGFAAARRDAWESEHFGVAIAKVGEVLTEAHGGDRARLAYRALNDLGRLARDQGVELLIARVDAEDSALLDAAQRSGFTVLETSLTYINDAVLGAEHHHRSSELVIEDYVGAEITRIDRQELALIEDQVATAVTTSHFHADTRLSRERSDALYFEWYERAFRNEWADYLVLARRDGVPVGFASWVVHPGLRDRHGEIVLVKPFAFAVQPLGKGAGSAITRHACTTRPLGARWLEYSTQVTNLAVNNLVAHQYSLNLARAEYVMHCWLDGPR